MKPIRMLTIIDVDRAGGIDPERLLRAMQLRVERVGRGQYRVTGGDETHYVDLIDPRLERCDCADHLLRQLVCKHLLACLLREGDDRVIRSLGRLMRQMDNSIQRLRTAARGPRIVLTKALRERVAAEVAVTPDELQFCRDPDGETGDVAVLDARDGQVIGILRRERTAPKFTPVRRAVLKEAA
jgi:hypothetical protein